jgi:outer membrane protein TolC
MRRLAWLFLSFLILSLAVWSPAHAQEPGERSVTLAEVVAKARQNPPAVLSALATVERFEAQEHLARGSYLPRLTFSGQGGVLYNNSPTISVIEDPPGSGNVRYDKGRLDSVSLNALGSATLDWTLFDASRGGSVDSAKAQTKQQRFSASGTQRLAIQAAAELYVRGLYADQLIQDAQLSVQRRNDQLQSISALVKAGVRPAVDVERASIEAVAARHALDIRIIEHKAAMAALASALGEDPARPVRPAALDEEPFTADTGLNEATRLAIDNRPEIQAAESLLAARQAEDRAARGLRVPTLGVSGTGQVSYLDVRKGEGIDGNQYTANGIMYLRWAALDATVWRRAKVTAKAVLEAQKNVESTILSVRAQVAEAAYTAQRAKAQLDQAAEVLVSATTTRVAQNQRYRAGVATLLDLLDAEDIEQRARMTRIEASRDYDLSRARLLAVCGAIERIGKQ